MSQQAPIYLDYAAATPLDERVLAAMRPYFSEAFYNPSATYTSGQAVRKALEAARSKVALQFGAKASEVIFTAGGTEANNLAIHGLLRQYPKANIVVSAIEHDAVLEPAANYEYRVAPVDKNGVVDLARLEKLIDGNTVLVSVMYANNEIGTIQPLRKISQLVQQKRRARTTKLPLYFHSDACQAANYLDLHVASLGVDLLTINGGKIYGPKQSGALYVRAGISLEPLIDGGGQERGLRSGTENVAACIGLAIALEIVQADRHSETKRLQALQQQFLKLVEAQIPSASVTGSLKHRLPNNVHLIIPGQDNERLLIQLDEAGIMAAAGSACSASSDTPSHVLRALGFSDAEAQASLRFTMGRQTSAQAITHTVQTLADLLA